MNRVEKGKEEVVHYARAIEKEGLIFGTWGNVSCRPEKERVVVTPSGIPCQRLQFVDMAVVNLEGEVEEGRWKPSSELPLHLEIYKARQDVQAIIHTHSKYASVFAVVRQEIAAVTEEMAQLLGGSVPVAEYALPGGRELAVNTARAVGKSGHAVLLANHGVVCLGETLAEAFQRCQVIERGAEILLWASLLGTPVQLSQEEINTLRESFLKHYGQDT